MRSSFALAISLLLFAAPAAHARDATITSFDGTQMSCPSIRRRAARQRRRSSRVTAGPARQTSGRGQRRTTGNVGVGALRKASFNVLTWDSRGFGNSGGTVTVDAPDAEAATSPRCWTGSPSSPSLSTRR
jgi:ABC-2 type transport system ATP-binding protein